MMRQKAISNTILLNLILRCKSEIELSRLTLGLFLPNVSKTYELFVTKLVILCLTQDWTPTVITINCAEFAELFALH